MLMKYKTGIGQDSHRFELKQTGKKCIIAGIPFDGVNGFCANSDGDVVYHAITNAISSITGELILGNIADTLCLEKGVTDSEVYLKEALKTLKQKQYDIVHIAISLEGKKPRFKEQIPEMRKKIAKVTEIEQEQVGITATTGEELTSFGKGEGVQCLALISVYKN